MSADTPLRIRAIRDLSGVTYEVVDALADPDGVADNFVDLESLERVVELDLDRHVGRLCRRIERLLDFIQNVDRGIGAELDAEQTEVEFANVDDVCCGASSAWSYHQTVKLRSLTIGDALLMLSTDANARDGVEVLQQAFSHGGRIRDGMIIDEPIDPFKCALKRAMDDFGILPLRTIRVLSVLGCGQSEG